MITNHLYFYKHALSEMGICLFKKKEKKTYIFVKLFKQNEAKHKPS
jgi:hypothetical protein